MKIKIVVILIFFIFVYYFMIPEEWFIIYKNLSSNTYTRPIIIPVISNLYMEFDDSFGAARGPLRIHEGIDLMAPLGSKVISCQNGIILFSGRNTIGGNVIKIFGRDNLIYYYAHLLSCEQFKTGDYIKQGTVIGYVGNTGNAASTAPHLHFEMMQIKWLFPLVTENLNPYYKLNGKAK